MNLWRSYDWSYGPVAIMIFVARMGRKILYDIVYSMAWIDGKYWCAFSRLFLLAFHVSWIAFFRLGLKLDYNDTSVGAVCLDFRLVGSCWNLLIWNTVWPDDLQWQCFLRTGAACLLYKVFTPKHGQQFTVWCMKSQGFQNWWSQDQVDVCWPKARVIVTLSKNRYTDIHIYICLYCDSRSKCSGLIIVLTYSYHPWEGCCHVYSKIRHDMTMTMTHDKHWSFNLAWPAHILCQRWQCQDLWQNGIPPLAYFIHLYLSLFTLTRSNYSRNFWTKPFEAHTLSSA